MGTKIWGVGLNSDNQVTKVVVAGREAVGRLEGVTLAASDQPDDFRFEQTSVTIGNYLLRRISVTPARIERPYTPESSGQLRFTFVLKGSMTITQAGRRVLLNPGDGAVSIGWQSYLSVIPEDTTVVRVTIERDILDSKGILFPHSVRKLSQRSILSSGLAAFFNELFDPRYYPLPPVEVARMSDLIDAFFVELHLAYVEKFRAAEDRKEDQRAAVMGYIRGRAGDPDLTVASIAEHYDMSMRTLQRLFRDAGTSLRNEVAAVVAQHESAGEGRTRSGAAQSAAPVGR